MLVLSLVKQFARASLAALALYLFLPSASAQLIPGPGQTNFTATNIIFFAQTNYFVSESGLFAAVVVRRTGDVFTGDSVQVSYSTQEGTAISGRDFLQLNNGTLQFFPGITQQTIIIPIVDNYSSDGNRFFSVNLFNPLAGAPDGAVPVTLVLLGNPSSTTVTILDDEIVAAPDSAGIVELSSAFYEASTEEWNTDSGNNLRIGGSLLQPAGPAGVEVTIVRRGGSRGRILVDWNVDTDVLFIPPIEVFTNEFGATFEFGGLAVPSAHFLPTNGTVVLDDFQMSTNIVIRLPAITASEPWASFYARTTTNQIPPPPRAFAVHLTGVRPATNEIGFGINPTLGVTRTADVQLAEPNFGFCFTRALYVVREGQRFVRVRVRRSQSTDPMNPLGPVHVHYAINPERIVLDARGGDHLGNTARLSAGSEYTTPFIDYEPAGTPVWSQTVIDNDLVGRGWVDSDGEATISWGDGEVTDKFILVPVMDDREAEFNEDIHVVLWKHPDETDGTLGWLSSCTIKVIDNDQPAGASEVTFNPDIDPRTTPPYNPTPGANNTVQAVVVQPDGKVILGGDFNKVNTFDRNKIARLNFDGSNDGSFITGTGISGFVRALALQPDGRILVAGGFDAYNGVPSLNIVRLLPSGALDGSFNPRGGADAPIRAVALQPDGKILIGGDFTSYDGTNVNFFARLNTDGSLDTSFATGTGPDGPVNSIAVSSGSIEIERNAAGGPAEDRYAVDTGSSRGVLTINYDFLQVPDSVRVYYGGVPIFDSGLISSNGTITVNYPPAGTAATSTVLEIVMNEGVGLEGTVWLYTLRVDPEVDPRPVIGGEFTSYNGVSANFIARVNLDGSLDRTFDVGSGADERVYAVAKQGNKVIMAGDFTSVNLSPRRGVARLNEDGSLDQTFDPGTGFDNTVFTLALQPTGKPVLGGAFRSFNQTRRIGLARLNFDGTLDTSFMDTAKNQFAGVPNPLNPENIESQENFIRSLAPYRLTNFSFVTNFVVTNDVTNAEIVTNIFLTDHVFIGGRFSRVGGGFFRDEIRPRMNLARVVGGATPGPGNVSFERDNYSVDENAGSTFITLLRTNGSLAPISARFDAQDFPVPGTGVGSAGLDYQATNYFPLWIRSHNADRQYSDAYMGPNFGAYTTNRARNDFTVYTWPAKPAWRTNNFAEDNVFLNVFDDDVIEGDEVASLTLTAPDLGRLVLGGEPIPVGTALGKSRATLTVADNDFNFGTLGFASAQYFVDENGGNALITLSRVGGSSGTVTVDVSTRNGSAVSGVVGTGDYTGINRRTITFANGQLTNQFVIPINNDTIAELEETVLLLLTNATGFPANIPPAQRLDPERSTAVLNIIDDDYAPGRISFEAPSITVDESAGTVTVQVRRNGGNAGDVSVSFRTENGSAREGVDYVSTNGILRWTDQDTATKSVTIPLINNDKVEGEKTFSVVISDPRPLPSMAEALGAQTNIVVRISNDDTPGIFSFSQFTYNVDENAPYADITVVREGGISGVVTVRFAAADATAIGTTNVAAVTNNTGLIDYVFPQYVAANGFTNILRFEEGQTAASFRIPIIDDAVFDGAKQLNLALFNATGGAQMALTNAVLVIVDNEENRIPAGLLDTEFAAKGADDYIYSLALEPDGNILVGGDFRFMNDVARNRLARLLPNGVLDQSFVATAGPNDSVRSIDVRDFDERIILGGLFTSLGITNRFHISRLNTDGLVDTTFDPGSGTDNPVYALVEQADGKVIIAGSFSSYRLVPRKGIARISTNGLLDTTFDPGTGANAEGDTANVAIWAVALQRDGKILIGGDFTSFDGVPRGRIARLNRDGTVDRTFGEAMEGANGSVRTIVVQSDGSILVGGLFTSINGRPYNRIVRLRSTGANAGEVDETFTLGAATDLSRATNGANGAINVIAVQLDGKILVGGDFTSFNGRTRSRLTRLNSDGSLDPTINFGAGANGPVSSIIVQPDRKILIAGGFTVYDGAPAGHIARIHGGALAGSGQLQFTSPFFSASETDANAVLNIRRTGGTTGTLRVSVVTLTNDTAIPGVDFQPSTNVIEFPEAETFRSVLIRPLRNTNALEDRHIEVVLTNLVGNGSLGAQPRARLTVLNVDTQIEFSRTDYSVAEDFAPGAATITVRRVGSTNASITVDFVTRDNSATGGSDYGVINTTIPFAPGEVSRTVAVPVFDDLLVEGDERVTLVLTNLAGLGMIRTPAATLTIVDNDFSPGSIEFTTATYVGLENSRQLVFRLRRVAGTTGVISVEYDTLPGGENPAQSPSDYQEVRGGIVSFSDGVVDQSFVIQLVDDQLVEGNETFTIVLSNPKGGASISGSPEAIGIIVDDDLPSGSLDRTFDPGTGANGEIRTLKLDSTNRIVIGGDFTVFNGVNRSHLARLSPDAAVDNSFDPGVGPDATVADIDLDPDGRFTIGGQFNTIRGLFLNRVARLMADGSPDSSFALPLGLNAEVSDVLRQPDGKVLIGGTFDVVDAAILNHVARLNADGTVDIGFNPGGGTDGNVTALALQPDGKILIGGTFSRIDGVFKSGIVRVNPNGTVDTAFNAAGNGATGGGVQDILVLADGKLLIVGDFTTYNGTGRARVARLNADGGLDTTFNSANGPNGIVYAAAQQSDGKFIIVGDFTSVNGLSRNRIARLNTDGTHDDSFKPGSGANDAILAVAIQPEDGRVLIAGRFTQVDNESRPRIARLNNDKNFIVAKDVVFAPVTRSGDKLQFTVETQAGFTYTLESSTTLTGSWTSEESVVAQGTTTLFEIVPSEAHQFFRIRRE